MKFSILDQAPISDGQTAQDALQNSIELAQLGEELGYERFWIAEHHDLFGLANPNPAVMISAIGAQTSRIRIGAGAVLLPYYKPFHVAETYNLLATLYPDRIDLGLGRAPGGPAEVSLALSDNYLQGVRDYPDLIDELHMFLTNSFPTDHPNSKITPTPVPEIAPRPWILGTSEKSALLAAKKKMDYVFGHFMTEADGPEIVKAYRAKHDGKVIIAVHVICAETTEEAEQLALSQLLWKERQQDPSLKQTIPSVAEAKEAGFSEQEIKKLHEKIIIGNPGLVKEKLEALQAEYEADEWMIITITHDARAKRKSYTLLVEEFSI